MNHPWMNEGLNVPFSPVPFPLTSDNIKEEIVEHVVQKRKVRCLLHVSDQLAIYYSIVCSLPMTYIKATACMCNIFHNNTIIYYTS